LSFIEILTNLPIASVMSPSIAIYG